MFARERRGEPSVDDPLPVVHRELSAASGPDLKAFYPSVHRLVEEQYWEGGTNANAPRFESFADFAVARRPHGLQIWTDPTVKVMRTALLDTGHVPYYVELLNKIRRPNGAPRKTFTLSEAFCPSTASQEVKPQ
jgi:hypothetical protein